MLTFDTSGCGVVRPDEVGVIEGDLLSSFTWLDGKIPLCRFLPRAYKITEIRFELTLLYYYIKS